MELFISDLDGTLLNSDAKISELSEKILNGLINNGVNFTIATARTPATAIDILKGLDIKIPTVMMNGVLIYDINKQEYIDVKDIDKKVANKVLDVFKEYNKDCFMYGIKENHLWVYHKVFTCSMEQNFYDERCNKPLKTFVKVGDYYDTIDDSNIINFIIFDKLEVVEAIYGRLKDIEGITVDYYKDIYGDGYYLDAYSDKASKANGIRYLSRYIDEGKIISFGDNMNDIPMFKISDECYATSNAAEKLKCLATKVIGSNNEDGVAKFMEERFKLRK